MNLHWSFRCVAIAAFVLLSTPAISLAQPGAFGGGYGPPLSVVPPPKAFTSSDEHYKFLLAAGYMSEYTTFLPNHPKFGSYDEIIFRLLSSVEGGQMPAKQAVDVAAGELQAQLKDELIVK